MAIAEVRALCENLKRQVAQVVIGQDDVVEGLLVALLSRGHILLEGVPGTGKTLLAQAFARCLQLQFGRIQFTPDLMPGDVLGSNLYNFQSGEFSLTKGPIFSDFLLGDEINRTPPKTQAALLQAMAERSVTIDGKTYSLPASFMVVATQNPVEHEGTYPLPEAQLDRFLLKHVVGYPSRDHELKIVATHGNQTATLEFDKLPLAAVTDANGLQHARDVVAGLRLADEMIAYVVDLVRETRQSPHILHGASPRAANMLATASRAVACLRGRDYVIPDDVKELFLPLMRHRVVVSASAEVEGISSDKLLNDVLSAVPAPR